MKKIILIILLSLSAHFLFAAPQYATEELQYRRSSIYSILLNHREQKYADEIFQQFSRIPVPDKYNDHSLSVVGLSVDKAGNYSAAIDDYITRNHIASRMVGKWFNRDPRTGVCNMDLIKARGLYNASEFDKAMAQLTVRKQALLEDAGENLIGNTFLLVNEINYVDKSEGAKVAAGVLMALGAILGTVAAVATGDSRWVEIGTGLGVASGALAATYKGFKVRIITHLYQLEWNEEMAATFYANHYTEVPDEAKKQAFENDRDIFRLRYIGKVVSSGNQTSFLGINEEHPEVMVRKACQRAIDENVVDLQRAYEVFRVKSPILAVAPTLTIPIGKKEGVTKDSKFEVLEAVEKEGKITYNRVGTITPVPSKIWDNRFMAQEEGAEGADLGCTTFKKLTGRDLFPGMLVREIY